MAEDDENLKFLSRPGLERAAQTNENIRRLQSSFAGLGTPGMLSGPDAQVYSSPDISLFAPYIPHVSQFRGRAFNARPEDEVLRAYEAGTPLWAPRSREAALEAYGYEEGPEGLGFFS